MNVGTEYGGSENYKLTFSKYVTLRAGINKLSILSVAVGLPVSIFRIQNISVGEGNQTFFVRV